MDAQEMKMLAVIILAAGGAAALVVGAWTGSITGEHIRLTVDMVLAALFGSTVTASAVILKKKVVKK